MNTISDAGSLPLYARVEAILLKDISEGLLGPGDQLPPEEQLIDRFQVSRTTIRKAIENLIASGRVEIRRGKGTFVTQPKITQALTELTGFAEDMVILGRHPSSRLLDKKLIAADKAVAHALDKLPGTLVYKIERVRLADGMPMSFDETYLPRNIGEKVVSNNLEIEPIFDLLENKYALPLIEARYQLEAVVADQIVAQALNIECGAPIFLIERTSYTTGQQPIDYEKLYYRGDSIRFATQLSRRPRSPAGER
ncbi:GntR family transcriptional regulator [Advenella kashmirensis W13003]|uniref:GntR family transcriptional regulator n=1 Tax=Advenella kashmirensis W13003 TaxID=1424334 RepID=V8QNX3_9BURK|nr:GntR family transcriptional regulator [Advenella kashmirensis]ETF01357.1 GntR family transcriptional regulator [Advenella kashmirensis W13003]